MKAQSYRLKLSKASGGRDESQCDYTTEVTADCNESERAFEFDNYLVSLTAYKSPAQARVPGC